MNDELCDVEVVVDVVKRTSLVSKETASAIGAMLVLLESLASFALVLDVCWERLLRHLVATVGKLALLSVAATANFDPILAHLGFVLGSVDPFAFGSHAFPVVSHFFRFRCFCFNILSVALIHNQTTVESIF